MLKVLRKMVTIPVKQTDLTSSSPSGSKGLEKSQAHAVRKFSSAQVPMKITDYQLSKKLSEGSFGVVYLAKDKSNSQLYAIKVSSRLFNIPPQKNHHQKTATKKKSDMLTIQSLLHRVFLSIKIVDKTKLDDEKELKNLAAESKTMMKLRNKPFVIHLYASFSNERYVFFVLDLAEMGDLRMVLEEFGVSDSSLINFICSHGFLIMNVLVMVLHSPSTQAMSPYHAGYYIVQISAGLSALHNSRIIYRDLKLDNVLISHDGSVKLADFGLSKDVHNTGGRAMTFCGTLHYIAPEIILGGPYTYAVDWYALGLLVHLLYTGTFPLAGGEPPGMDQFILLRVKPLKLNL